MKVRILRPARFEIRDAFTYYRSISQPLARNFAADLRAIIQLIVDAPTAWPRIGSTLRRRNLHRFPYSVIYQVEDSSILIVAFLNLHRDPEHWRDRLREIE